MPYVKIELIEGRSEKQKADIAEAVTRAIVDYGGAKAADIDIVFVDIEPGNWAISGQLISRSSGVLKRNGSPETVP